MAPKGGSRKLRKTAVNKAKGTARQAKSNTDVRADRSYDTEGEDLLESKIEVTLDSISSSARLSPLPPAITQRIEDEISLATGEPGYLPLMRELWRARARLIYRKVRDRGGQARLAKRHRVRLVSIEKSLSAAARCLKPGDFSVAQLVDVNINVRELVELLEDIAGEARRRLAIAANQRIGHRPADVAISEFYGDVVAALQAAGERCPVVRSGVVAAVAAVLLGSTRYPVPRDPLRHIARAVADQPAHLARRRTRVGNLPGRV